MTLVNPTAFRMDKTLLSFRLSECNRVKVDSVSILALIQCLKPYNGRIHVYDCSAADCSDPQYLDRSGF